jgi:hypothetical protein
MRVADSLASVTLVAIGVGVLSLPIDWVPWLLSVGSFVGGLLCRQLLLKPLVRRESMEQPKNREGHMSVKTVTLGEH